jgi:tetratricopeptide (TPR) repeat protein
MSGKDEEAIAKLKQAIEGEPNDGDLFYQLGHTLLRLGRQDEASQAMVRVLELDEEESPSSDAPEFADVQELRSRLEGVMEELPEPMLTLVAHAPITVQSRATKDQVRQGADPRGIVLFLGTPQSDNEEAELTGIVIVKDLLVDEVEDDDEIATVLLYSVMEAIADFFDRDDFVMAEA